MDEYEYEAQWWSDGSDSWFPMGWKGTQWVSTIVRAKAIRDGLAKGTPPETQFRIVRRRKAGPVEVING